MFSFIFSMETVKIENKLDQDESSGKEEKIRQLWQELIESEMRYVEDLNEVRGIEETGVKHKWSQICRDYIHSQPDQTKKFFSLDRKHFKTLKKRAKGLHAADEDPEVEGGQGGQVGQGGQGSVNRRFTESEDCSSLAPPTPAE